MYTSSSSTGHVSFQTGHMLLMCLQGMWAYTHTSSPTFTMYGIILPFCGMTTTMFIHHPYVTVLVYTSFRTISTGRTTTTI